MNVKNLLAALVMAAPASALAANAIKVVPTNGGVKSPIVVPGQFMRYPGLNTGLNTGVPFLTPTLKSTVIKVDQAPAVGMEAAQQVFATLNDNPSMQALGDKSEAAQGDYATTLNNVYDQSGITGENAGASVNLGEIGSGQNGLSKVTGSRSMTKASPIASLAVSADNAGGAGVGDGIRRLWNVTVGKFLRWVFGVEKKNAKAIAANIISELNNALPKMNESAAEIGKTVHLLKIQVDEDTKKSAALEAKATQAYKSGKDAQGDEYLKQKALVDASLAATSEQYAQAKKNQEWALKQVKDFYYERQAKLQEIQNMLSRDEMATMSRRMNELKGQFKIGDIAGQMDKLKEVVNDNEASAKGQQDVIDASGDTLDKEIEDDMRNDAIAAERERIKAKIAEQKK